MKWIAAALAALTAGPLVVLMMVIFPDQLLATCYTEGPLEVVAAGPSEFTPSQVAIAEAIREAAGDDDYLTTLGVTISLALTNLSAVTYDEHGYATPINPMTGEWSDATPLEAAQAFVLTYRLSNLDASMSPAEVAADLTGMRASEFDSRWPQAVRLVAQVSGADSLELGVSDAADDPCSDALLVAWNQGAVVVEGGWAHPLLGQLDISSPFGWRRHPITGEVRLHAGTDYQAPCGSVIVAIADGGVTRAGASDGYGNLIVITHDNGFQSRYAHMEDAGVLVNPGDAVRQGQIIGLVGDAGTSTGCHLHFEIHLPTGQVADSQSVLGF